jgi:hypothetical protein
MIPLRGLPMLVVLAGVLVGPGPTLAGQEPDLEQVAVAARKAFRYHDFSGLIRPDDVIRLRLPSQAAGAPIRGGVAAAALAAFARRAEELEVTVVGAAVVESRQGYVELRRRFRPLGLEQAETQRILVSVRFQDGAWRVVEVWVVSP